jgi:uncharacterized protein with PIN domain
VFSKDGVCTPAAYPDAVDEQSNRGNRVETRCRYCGGMFAADAREDKAAAADQYQVVVACAECGNDFAKISRN